MKLTPDYKDRNDEYDDETFRFWEDPENQENDYFYEIYVMADEEKARVVVTENGVSIDFKDSGRTIFTPLTPNKMFKAKTLNWDHLEVIIKVLNKNNCEGIKATSEEMRELYTEWLLRGKP